MSGWRVESTGWDSATARVHGSALGGYVSKRFVSRFLLSCLETSGARALRVSAANPGLCPSLSQPNIFGNYCETSFLIGRAKNLILQTTWDLVMKCCQHPKEAKT